MSAAGAAAIAVIHMKERHIVDAFRKAGVTTAESARAPEELNIGAHGAAWRALRDQEIVREAGGGRYYLDVLSWEANRRSRMKRVAILTVVLIALAFWLIATRP